MLTLMWNAFKHINFNYTICHEDWGWRPIKFEMWIILTFPCLYGFNYFVCFCFRWSIALTLTPQSCNESMSFTSARLEEEIWYKDVLFISERTFVMKRGKRKRTRECSKANVNRKRIQNQFHGSEGLTVMSLFSTRQSHNHRPVH